MTSNLTSWSTANYPTPSAAVSWLRWTKFPARGGAVHWPFSRASPGRRNWVAWLPSGPTNRQRFLRGGPLALLPLADGRCSIVWSTAAEHADELVAMAPEAFSDAVSEASEHVLGRLELDGERRSFPLRFLQAGRYRAPRLALVGDAAHVVHPLAGQGVNLGLLDAAALAGVLGTAGASRTDPGSARLLGRYERWRKGHNLLVGGVMHGFKHLFGNASPVLILARDSGLSLVDRSGPVKRAIMRQAMGLEGDLPPLARIAPA